MGNNTAYTQEQEDFILNNFYGISRKELTKRFNEKFNTNKSYGAIKTWCNNRNLNCGNDGRFNKGDAPWNAGITGDEYFNHYDREKTKEHMNKVHENNRSAILGEERLLNGVPHVCVVAGRRTKKYERWRRKRLVVYEQNYGPIPKGHCIISLDGDKTNCDISNLACIPKKYMTLLSKNQWFAQNKMITKSAVKWCELHYAIKQE